MNLEDLTIKEVREIQTLFADAPMARHRPSHSFEIGKNYLRRCVTHIQLGHVKSVTDTDIVLGDASWVADTGRFNEALKNGTISENEPFWGDVIVSRGAIVDAALWIHPLLDENIK